MLHMATGQTASESERPTSTSQTLADELLPSIETQALPADAGVSPLDARLSELIRT